MGLDPMTCFSFKTGLGLPEWLFSVIRESDMPTIKLTDKSIDRLPAPHRNKQRPARWQAGTVLVRRAQGTSASLVSGTTSAKSYIVQHALKDGRRRRVTIGPCNVMRLDEAEVEAKKTLATFYAGKDPKTLSRDNPTLRSALDAFLLSGSDLRPKSIHFYNDKLGRYLGGLDGPAAAFREPSNGRRAPS